MNQPDSSPENLLKEIESLRQKLAAKEKTIAVLTKRVLEKQTQRTSDFSLLEENFSLQGVVTRKTVELEEQNNKLEEAHRALKQAQSELLQAQKLESIGRLAAGIAHEINTPVQYIADNIYFIQDTFGKVVALEKLTREIIDRSLAQNKTCLHAKGLKEEFEKLGINFAIAEIPKAIEDAIEGTQRVSRIVKAMKEFSHPGTKDKVIADLNQAIQTTISVTRNEWKYVAELETILDPKLPKVPCYLGEFNQCILNLIINAAHAIEDVLAAKNAKDKEKGKITIETRLTGDLIEIRVGDTGTGIPEKIRNHIFEPFFTTKPPGKGTGQGLALVYSYIVKKHHGSIDIESEIGKGTTIILKLPVK